MIIDQDEISYETSEHLNVVMETTRDWLAVVLQLVIIILLAILSILSTVAIHRLNEQPDIKINLIEPARQPTGPQDA